MTTNVTGAFPTPNRPAKPSAGARACSEGKKHKWKEAILGIGAEILFACGLIVAGFLISLLSGW